MALELIWRGPELEAALAKASFTGVQSAGVHLWTKARMQISKPVRKVRRTRTRTTSRGKKGSSYMQVIERSKIGEPPRLDTGFGRDNCVREDDQATIAARVGIQRNAMYMFKHEVTGRNWLRRTLTEELPVLTSIITTVAQSEMKGRQ